ncbi:hypothetical protein [Nitrosopumilus adriaticus]|uniref:hypothetical protein n=1 Tax=Nitrosopumilus adriaticus TaxID=1580092 RepID=UPI00352C2EDF
MECNGPQCSVSQVESHNSCDCPSCTGQNPVDFIELTWHKAAMNAILEAKKDRIKSRIEKQMGDALDQGADAVVEYIHKKISAAITTAGSEQELKNKLFSILKKAC